MLKKLVLSLAEGPISFILASLRSSTYPVRFESSLAEAALGGLFEHPSLRHARGDGYTSSEFAIPEHPWQVSI